MVYKISEHGLKILEQPDTINEFVKQAIQKRRAERNEALESEDEVADEDDLTPEEALYESFQKIKQSIYSEILDIVTKRIRKSLKIW